MKWEFYCRQAAPWTFPTRVRPGLNPSSQPLGFKNDMFYPFVVFITSQVEWHLSYNKISISTCLAGISRYTWCTVCILFVRETSVRKKKKIVRDRIYFSFKNELAEISLPRNYFSFHVSYGHFDFMGWVWFKTFVWFFFPVCTANQAQYCFLNTGTLPSTTLSIIHGKKSGCRYLENTLGVLLMKKREEKPRMESVIAGQTTRNNEFSEFPTYSL